MPPTITVVVSIVALLLFLTLGFFLGVFYRKKVAEREISSAEDEATRGSRQPRTKNVRRFWRPRRRSTAAAATTSGK